MKIAYIILAHKHPEQLLRLITTLQSQKAFFFLHIDNQVNIHPFKKIINNEFINNIFYVKRENGRWGRLGIVKGTINALKAIKDSAIDFDYIVLLSGLDYPLRSNSFIQNYFEQHYGKNFLTYFPLQEPSNWMPRIKNYHFNFLGKYLAYPSQSENIQRKFLDLVLLLPVRFPRKREFPKDLQPYGGSQWWCITPDTATYILEFLNKRPEYVKYHEHSLLPDEMFFQTIILNSSNDKLLESLVNDNLKLIDWSRPKPRPAVFTFKDFSMLVNSDKLFARKFDTDIDCKILDLLDNENRLSS